MGAKVGREEFSGGYRLSSWVAGADVVVGALVAKLGTVVGGKNLEGIEQTVGVVGAGCSCRSSSSPTPSFSPGVVYQRSHSSSSGSGADKTLGEVINLFQRLTLFFLKVCNGFFCLNCDCGGVFFPFFRLQL